jgi:hypothetical protein
VPCSCSLAGFDGESRTPIRLKRSSAVQSSLRSICWLTSSINPRPVQHAARVVVDEATLHRGEKPVGSCPRAHRFARSDCAADRRTDAPGSGDDSRSRPAGPDQIVAGGSRPRRAATPGQDHLSLPLVTADHRDDHGHFRVRSGPLLERGRRWRPDRLSWLRATSPISRGAAGLGDA